METFFLMVIKGEITSVKSPSVNFNFQVEKRIILHKESDVALNNISLNGKLLITNENAIAN